MVVCAGAEVILSATRHIQNVPINSLIEPLKQGIAQSWPKSL